MRTAALRPEPPACGSRGVEHRGCTGRGDGDMRVAPRGITLRRPAPRLMRHGFGTAPPHGGLRVGTVSLAQPRPHRWCIPRTTIRNPAPPAGESRRARHAAVARTASSALIAPTRDRRVNRWHTHRGTAGKDMRLHAFKEGRALRTETTINDTYDIGVGRSLENLPKLIEFGRVLHSRLLAASARCLQDLARVDQVLTPTIAEGQRVPALRFGDPRAFAVEAALCRFAVGPLAPPRPVPSAARRPRPQRPRASRPPAGAGPPDARRRPRPRRARPRRPRRVFGMLAERLEPRQENRHATPLPFGGRFTADVDRGRTVPRKAPPGHGGGRRRRRPPAPRPPSPG